MSVFRTNMSISIWDGTEKEFELVIHYTVTPGMPEVGRGYLADPANYDPGSPDEVFYDRITLMTEGGLGVKVMPTWMVEMVRTDDDLRKSVLAEWREDRKAEREYARE
jgi:hypothetical protein